MYIDRIQLQNIRGFRELDFSLARPDGNYAGWTVFTGDNGSGKSSLLKAIAVALAGKDSARALQPSFQGWLYSGEKAGSVQLEVVRVPEDDKVAAAGKPPRGESFPARLLFSNGGREPVIEVDRPAGKQRNYQIPQRTIWSMNAQGWFSCGYGPFRRVFGASPEATRMMVSPTTERFVTMFHEAASLAEVDQWLRSLSHKALEGKTEEKELLQLISLFLLYDLLPNGMTVDRVDSDGLWLRDINQIPLSWGDMSDGYRAALALVTDILRHLISAYGADDLFQLKSSIGPVVERSGVVLIDEIDAHLHPEWQRTIGFWLKERFPFIQFLVTSHSPLICQAADPNGIFVLPEPGSDNPPRAVPQEEYERIIASRPDTILRSSAFGLTNTRSPRAVEARAEYSKLAAKKRSGARLSKAEQEKFGQLALFARDEEEN